MELLLLTDIPGIGKKDDLVVVGDGFALNYVLPSRQGLVATPNVRRRYAEQIKKRAEQREQELQVRKDMLATVSGKKVTLTKKTTKTGKLYASVTPAMIAEAFAKQHNTPLTADAIEIPEHIKTTGTHSVTVRAGDATTSLTVDVRAE